MIAEVIIVHGSESISTLIMINVECSTITSTKPIKNTLVTDGSYCILALHNELCLLDIVLNHGHSKIANVVIVIWNREQIHIDND